MFQLDKIQDVAGSVIAVEVAQIAKYGDQIAALYLCQRLNGFRYGELANCTGLHVLFNCVLMVPGSKGSRSGLAFMPGWEDHLERLKGLNLYIWFGINYMRYYRAIRAMNLHTRKAGRQKATVTHIGRQQLVQYLLHQNADLQTITDILGHKSGNSLDHYLN